MKSGIFVALFLVAPYVFAGEAISNPDPAPFPEVGFPKPEIAHKHHPLLRTAVRGAIDGGFAATSAKFAASGGVFILLVSIAQKAETICLRHTGSHSCAALRIGE